MSLTPLLAASPAIQFHAAAAMAAFALGFTQLMLRKGTGRHRLFGWVWVALMAIVAATSFWIHELRVLGPWSPIHLLSIWVLIALPLGLYAARRGRIAWHRRTMIGTFTGGLVIAGLFTFVPGRIMYDVLFGG